MEAEMSPRFQKNNRIVPAILEMLETCEEATALEIHQAVGSQRRYIEHTLTRMMEAGMIYIIRYEMPDIGRGRQARVFALGDKPNAKMRRRTANELKAYKNNWQRSRRASQKVIAKVQKMGPFGVLAAQVMV